MTITPAENISYQNSNEKLLNNGKTIIVVILKKENLFTFEVISHLL